MNRCRTSHTNAHAVALTFIEMFRNTIVSTSSALPNGEPDVPNLQTAFRSAFSFSSSASDPSSPYL
jgi:hypothetical protein